MSTKKSKGRSPKSQGKSPEVGNPPNTNVGNSFAFAVGTMIKESKQFRGSDTGFLGVPKETIDIKELNNSLTGKK